MESKNLPILIMLVAGFSVCVTCILTGFEFIQTLLIVLSSLIFFYFIGRIVKRIVDKINYDAQARAIFEKSKNEELGADAETTMEGENHQATENTDESSDGASNEASEVEEEDVVSES